MALNVSSAIQYNKNRGFEMAPIGVIQARVGARTHGKFDKETVTAIHDWQSSSHRMASLVPDGKIGKNTLGVMIAELRRANKMENASILSAYPHNLPVGGISDPDDFPILFFSHTDNTKLELRKPKPPIKGWLMKGTFEINLRIKSTVADPARYEYRQLVRGHASTTEGRFSGTESVANWRATKSEKSANGLFLIPGGLSNSFKEDGHKQGGVTKKFGYRSATPVHRPVTGAGGRKEGVIDRYLPKQDGHAYQCRDSYGLSFKGEPVVGTRIKLELHYMGYVYDKLRVQLVQKRTWGYKGTKYISSADV